MTTINNLKSSRFVEEIIKKLPSSCYVPGCDFKSTYEKVASHVPSCGHQLISCDHDGCNQMIKLKDLEDHKRIHLGSLIKCQHFDEGCGWNGSASKLAEHNKKCLHRLLTIKQNEVEELKSIVKALSIRVQELEKKNNAPNVNLMKTVPIFRNNQCTCNGSGDYNSKRYSCDKCKKSYDSSYKAIHACPNFDLCINCALDAPTFKKINNHPCTCNGYGVYDKNVFCCDTCKIVKDGRSQVHLCGNLDICKPCVINRRSTLLLNK
ncbi:hypothetical protein AKO1_000131 [Acrasis kona]|uniref:ZZ-type domain-containing protein n=1 Tax=Acrasis kona TaxID=1008807 RepID=A0AAW2ZE76_9EUKA